MAFDFYQLDFLFEGSGVYDVVLPFLLVFVVIFAFLQKTKILGDTPQAKKFNAVIGIVMGLLLVRLTIFVDMINNALPKISVVIVAVLMFLLILAMFSGDQDPANRLSRNALGFIAIASIAVVAWAFWSSYTGSDLPRGLWWVWDNLATIIIIGIFAGLVWYITSDGEGGLSTGDVEEIGKRAAKDRTEENLRG